MAVNTEELFTKISRKENKEDGVKLQIIKIIRKIKITKKLRIIKITKIKRQKETTKQEKRSNQMIIRMKQQKEIAILKQIII